MKKGFTLLEILLVIAAIGILAAIVIVAINPNRQLAQVRDTSRERDIRSIRDAIEQYNIDNAGYPVTIQSSYAEVCDTGTNGVGEGSVNADCVDLRVLVPTYLASIPVDPAAAPTQETGYYVEQNPRNSAISVASQLSETKDIAINPSITTQGLDFSIDLANTLSYPGTGTTIYDLSGNDLDVTLSNGAVYDSEFGGAILFDGDNDYASFTNPFSSAATSHTFEVWFKGEGGADVALGYAYIIHNGSGNNTGGSYLTMGVHGDGSYYGALNGAYNNMRTGINQNSLNVYHMVVSWDGEIQKVYMNGVEENQRALTNISNGLTSVTSIGSTANDPDYRPFDGRVYALRIYDRALSDQEVIQNFDAHRSRFGL